MKHNKYVKESFDHWCRMYRASFKIKSKFVTPANMKEATDEHWDGIYCSLCTKYYNSKNFTCKECPIYKNGNDCNKKYSIWHNIKETEFGFWPDWRDKAIEMIKLLFKLRWEK